MKRVTVIIPTFNRAPLLARAIDSALAQTAADTSEIIVVDDGSTDDTPAVLRRYEGRVRALRQPNSGAAAARNLGIRASDSEFVAFLDTDDEWAPDKTARQIEQFDRWPEAVLITGRALARYADGMVRAHPAPPLPFDRPVDFAPLLFDANFMPLPSVMVRRAALERSGLFDPLLLRRHDYHLWVRLACLGPGIFMNGLTAIYSDDTPGSLSRDKVECLRNKLIARRLLRAQLRLRPDCAPAWRRGMAACLAILRDQAYRKRRYASAVRYGIESFLHQPWPRAKWEWRRLASAAAGAVRQAPAMLARGAGVGSRNALSGTPSATRKST